EVMNHLVEILEKQRERDDDTLWALAFIDLWFCSNFHGLYWQPIVRQDHRNIRFAIQAALCVLLDSGSDGSAAVRQLIQDCCCEPEAREYLSGLGKDWEQWAGKALPHGQE